MRSKTRRQIVSISALFACLSLGGSPTTMAQNRVGHLRSLQAAASLQPVRMPLAPEEPSWTLLDGSPVVTARIATSEVFYPAPNPRITFPASPQSATPTHTAT